MRHHRIRSVNASRGIGPAVAVGLGLGLAAGFLAGEFLAAAPPGLLEALWRRWRGRTNGDRSTAAAADRLQEMLEHVLGPDGESIDLIPIGRNAVELHGWVTSRRARSRALGIARQSLGPEIRLVDGLLVWGEDDQPTGEHPVPPEGEAG
jgi:hypothetical protein